MKVLIRAATVIDPRSRHHGRKRDILLEGGVIRQIAAKVDAPGAREIRARDLAVSPGWIDLRAHFRDPGGEWRENLHSGAEAARAGGFTRVVLMPSTHPIVDSKSGIEYITRAGKGLPVRVYPTGSISQGLEGKQLAELFDMHSSGAVAFTDDRQPVGTELMVRALEYVRHFDGLIMTFPHDPGVNPKGMMHEGPVSASMGVKGLSALSESLRLQRDLELLRYCGGRLHVSLVSAAESVQLIRNAKKNGLKVTAAVAAHQFSFLDSDLSGFDPMLKVLPPFRSAEHRRALIRGISEGTIDAICSDHLPEDTEHKVCEWDQAEFGIGAIETAFCAAYTALADHVSLEQILHCFTLGPASVLGVQLPVVEQGQPAELTAFSPAENTRIAFPDRKSKGVNNPFLEKTLRGRVIPLA